MSVWSPTNVPNCLWGQLEEPMLVQQLPRKLVIYIHAYILTSFSFLLELRSLNCVITMILTMDDQFLKRGQEPIKIK
jgi:hypothetical protein